MWRRRRSWALEAPVGPVELVALSSQEATTCCTHPHPAFEYRNPSCPVFQYPRTRTYVVFEYPLPSTQYSSNWEPQFSWASLRNPPSSSVHKLLHTNTIGYPVLEYPVPSTNYPWRISLYDADAFLQPCVGLASSQLVEKPGFKLGGFCRKADSPVALTSQFKRLRSGL